MKNEGALTAQPDHWEQSSDGRWLAAEWAEGDEDSEIRQESQDSL